MSYFLGLILQSFIYHLTLMATEYIGVQMQNVGPGKLMLGMVFSFGHLVKFPKLPKLLKRLFSPYCETSK